jgi:hypothetical protein
MELNIEQANLLNDTPPRQSGFAPRHLPPPTGPPTWNTLDGAFPIGFIYTPLPQALHYLPRVRRYWVLPAYYARERAGATAP